MSVNDVRLILDGYTVSTPIATFTRAGVRYAMRDKNGHRVEFPLNVEPDHIRTVWIAFESTAAGEMPVLIGDYAARHIIGDDLARHAVQEPSMRSGPYYRRGY